jgi:site-specific DNA recombinase
VSDELWDSCNAILDGQEKKRTPLGPRTVHLLSGYVYCTCGDKMYVYTESPVYKCKKCKRKIRVSDLDEIYHDQLKSFLLTDQDIEAINDKSETTIAEKEALLRTVRDEYATLTKNVENWLSLRISGEFTKADFARVYKPAEQRLRQIEKEIPALEAERDFLKIQSVSNDTVTQEAKDLYQSWTKMPFEEKRTIIETITDKIIIDTESINIALSYIPTTHPFQNAGKRQHGRRDSSMRSA